MSWTLSKIYYAVTKDMQYAPNCSATLNPPSKLWLLKFLHISSARGHRSLNNTFLELFSSVWITLCTSTVHTFVLSCNTKRCLSVSAEPALIQMFSWSISPVYVALPAAPVRLFNSPSTSLCVCVFVCVTLRVRNRLFFS